MNWKKGVAPLQAVVMPGAARTSRTMQMNINLFNADGTPYVPLVATKAAAQADSTATDVPGLKTDFNALLAKLRAAGLLT